MMLPNPKLENWSVGMSLSSPYTAPEQVKAVLVGVVTGHPNSRIKDGTTVATSYLKSISFSKRAAKTANTEYDLGEPDPDFVKFLNETGSSIEKYEFEAL